MKLKIITLIILVTVSLTSCGEDLDDNFVPTNQTTLKFTHNWDGELVNNTDFNTLQYTNEKGDVLSIERLRYLISDITFTSNSNEAIVLDTYNLVDLADTSSLSYDVQNQIPAGVYTVSFTFGLNNEDNAQNYLDLNSASFNVPENLGGGYHYMQFDGKFLNSGSEEQGFNYHAIRAVDNPGENPTFPQDTFFTVTLGNVTITNNTEIEVKMNISEWFKNPNIWDLNQFNQTLMPNSAAQIMMFENGQTVFSLGEVSQ